LKENLPFKLGTAGVGAGVRLHFSFQGAVAANFSA
jgi:hypothetical protein